MERRRYRLGKRLAASVQTRADILSAALELVASGPAPTVGAVAERARVSRLTVYNQFGSRADLLEAVAAKARQGGRAAAAPAPPGDPLDDLQRRVAAACLRWASNPSLFRRLPNVSSSTADEAPEDRQLAERLAAADQLRAGCSVREAEDVIGALTSFPTFDRLYKDGRRSTAAVTEILMRLAAAILA